MKRFFYISVLSVLCAFQLTAQVINLDSILHVTCEGDTVGAIYISVSGGVLPYTYNWSTGDTSENLTGINAGTYVLTVTDSVSSVTTDTFAVLQMSPSVSFTIDSLTDVSCYGNSTGEVYISVSGGILPYSFLWNTGDTTDFLTGLSTGAYMVTVTDSLGCNYDTLISITQPPPLPVTIDSISDVSCNGDSTGEVYLSVSGSTPPYSFLWATGDTTSFLAGVPAGAYTVTVTDSFGCSYDTLTNIAQPVPFIVIVDSLTDVFCNDDSTGMVYLSVGGSTPPYSFLWNTGDTTDFLAGVPVGTYTITVTDSFNCNFDTSMNIIQPLPLTGSVDSITNLLCWEDSTGELYVSAGGGTAPYSFLWDTGDTTDSLSGVPAGTFTLTITDSLGCSYDTAVTLVNLPTPDTITIDTIIHVVCRGDSTGEVHLSVSGQYPPFNYLWSTGDTLDSLQGVPAGSYSVTVTDSMGCTISTSVVITQPQPLQAQVDSTWCFSPGNPSEGAIYVTVFGGTPPYTYDWSDGQTSQDCMGLIDTIYVLTVVDSCSDTLVLNAGNPCQTCFGNPLIIFATTVPSCYEYCSGSVDISISGGTPPYIMNIDGINWDSNTLFWSLCPGNYTIYVKDSFACYCVCTSAAVASYQPVALTVDNVQDVACYGDSTGAVDINMSGGYYDPSNFNGTYTYSWSNGETTQDLTNIPTGTYSVTASDQCATLTATVVVNEPPLLSITVNSVDHENCFGDSIGAVYTNIAGGAPPYTFLWSNGNNAQNNTGLTAGIYIVTVTDNNGCTDTAFAVVTEPDTLIIVGTISPVLCYGDSTGALFTTTIGGMTPYSWLWDNGNTSVNMTNVPTGIYSVTVTDNNGCTDTTGAFVTEPDTLIISIDSVAPVLCHGDSTGAVFPSATGGVLPYVWIWNSSNNTGYVPNVPAGAHTITVSDNNGCTDTTVAVVTEPDSLIILIDSVTPAILCNGDSTDVFTTTTGGIAPYIWSWSRGDTSADILDVLAGIYAVTITDNNGCTDTALVAVIEPDTLIIADSVAPVLCYGDNTGNVFTITTGGTTPYTWLWSSGDTSTNIINVSIGIYAVTVTDNNGCTDTVLAVVTEPDTLIISIDSVAPVLCNGDSTGAVFPSAIGGILPYVWVWNNDSAAGFVANVPAGAHTIMVSDNNGCTDTTLAIVAEPDTLIISIDSFTLALLCYGDSTGVIFTTTTGGIPPYEWLWSNGDTSTDIINVPAGVHTVAVTDINGCIATDTVTITEPAQLSGSITETDVLCFGGSNGSLCLNISGGIPAYSFSWCDGSTDQCFVNSPIISCCVDIIDSNGCTITVCGDIDQPDQLTTITTKLDASCFGICDGNSSSNVSGGIIPYSYLWDNPLGQTSAMAIGLCAEDYTCLVTDANGCIDTGFVNIIEPLKVVVSISSNVASCHWICDGEAVVTPNGLYPSYAYLWSDFSSQTDSTATGLCVGNYLVIVTDGINCKDSAIVTVMESPTAPMADFNPSADEAYLLESTIVFSNLSFPDTAFLDYQWSFGDGEVDNITNPTHTYNDPGVFNVQLIVFDSVGCADTIVRPIIIKGGYILFTPNAFTPNGDGVNDYFFPKGIGIQENKFEFYIYNRWGDLIFKSKGKFNENYVGWNGKANNGEKLAQKDVYVWKIETEDIWGLTHEYVGHVTLIR